jgi:hypothetical protein
LKIAGALKEKSDLTFQPTSLLKMDGKSGIFIQDSSTVKTEMPATDLARSIRTTNELTIAIWLQPGNLEQRGPARIVSLSKNTDHRNFTLGQSGAKLDFRVRTPLTGKNGSKVELTTEPLLITDKSQFVVATFFRGESKLYFNGQMVSPIIYSTSSYLPLLVGLGRNRFGKAAFCFMLLFPLGWLGRG